jgi:hypothetical protein
MVSSVTMPLVDVVDMIAMLKYPKRLVHCAIVNR